MWEVYAIKYADRAGRIRAHSFIHDDNHDAPHAMDYYMWVLRQGDQVILVDSGYDHAEGERRGRPIRLSPHAALAPLGLEPEDITTIICTHLHYDHAGGLHLFPNASIHLQESEMAYATGPCMCHPVLRNPYTPAHLHTVIDRLFSGRLVFHNGDGEIAEGVTVHCVGGHSRGLQVVRVQTGVGWMCLASDASHYYENFLAAKPFPIVVDLQNMLDGFDTVKSLASAPNLVIPGHDPLVREYFPEYKVDHVRRLDTGPLKHCPI